MKRKITLAITGHRDIIENDDLRQEVSDYLDDIIKHNVKREIVLLSPLADGADRFVAKLFLEKKQENKHLKLMVPMPHKLERYLEDFDEASKIEFLKLSNEAEKVFTIPHLTESAYLDVGRYVVDKSDVLLALWDGTFNGKVGGTGDVVSYARNRQREVVHFLCKREEALV